MFCELGPAVYHAAAAQEEASRVRVIFTVKLNMRYDSVCFKVTSNMRGSQRGHLIQDAFLLLVPLVSCFS